MTAKYTLTMEQQDNIKRLYQEHLLSYRDVAVKLELSDGVVDAFLRKYKLFRTHEEANAVVKKMKTHPIHTSRFRGILTDGGRGYLQRTLNPDDTYFAMVNKRNHVKEHRYVMATKIGRCLLRSEIVHHINGVRDDNRIENLELISRLNHNLVTKYCGNCDLKRNIRLLQFQNIELLSQIKKLTSIMMGLSNEEGSKSCDNWKEI